MRTNLVRNLGLAALLGGTARRSRGRWGRSSSFFGQPARRSTRTRNGGLLGSVLVAGAAYLWSRRRKAAHAGYGAGGEAVPEI